MNERSLRVLEFTKIRAQLAQYCVSDMGRALCDALTPSNRLEDVLRMQQRKRTACFPIWAARRCSRFQMCTLRCIWRRSVRLFRRAH